MRCSTRTLLVLGVAISASLQPFAASAASVRDLALREKRMLDDARDGRLNDFTLVDAALLASGILEPQQHAALQRQINQFSAEFKSELVDVQDPLERAKRIYELMHERILVGQYQSDCTQLPITLHDGNYNCVSATILFHILCHECGVNPVAVATPTHVYSRLHVGKQCIDVQTTCADWFRLSPEQQLRNTPVDVNASSNEKTSVDRRPREISDVQLLGKIYYNRGVQRLEAQQFDVAEAVFRVSLQLDPQDTTARENLLAGLNNWALKQCDRGDYEGAVKLLSRGAQVDANYGPFRTNDLHVHQRWAQELCEEGCFERAADMLEEGRARQPEAPLFRDGPCAVYRMWAANLSDHGDIAGAIRVLDSALQRYPDSKEITADRDRLKSNL